MSPSGHSGPWGTAEWVPSGRWGHGCRRMGLHGSGQRPAAAGRTCPAKPKPHHRPFPFLPGLSPEAAKLSKSGGHKREMRLAQS